MGLHIVAPNSEQANERAEVNAKNVDGTDEYNAYSTKHCPFKNGVMNSLRIAVWNANGRS